MKTKYNRTQLFGKWYRNAVNLAGHHVSEYAELTAEGFFEFTFTEQNQQGDVIEETTELGGWGLVGDIHFTITQEEIVAEGHFSADMTNAENYHAYKVLILDSQIFKYQHLVSKEVFIMRRVIDNIGHC